MNRQLKVILIGAGSRGNSYTRIMNKWPDKYQVVGVAEPVASRREVIRERHNIPDERCFTDWKPLLGLGKIADLAVIATMDALHYEPAMAAMALGYDILLEKPVAPEPSQCLEIARYAKEKGVKVIVCHELRFTPFFSTIKRIIDEGRLGDIISVNHEECVGNRHQSHSYVRGRWGNTARSSCMLLAKSCHDIDILQWLIGRRCLKVQSFGALTHFTGKNLPDGAPEYCIDGCPVGDTCPYNAVKLYLDDKKNMWFRSACTGESKESTTDELVEKALRTTQYGRCVYRCDNDVVDHQTVNMLFEDDITVTFTMCAFNKGGRNIHIMGTKGELRAFMKEDRPITVYDFETRNTIEVPIKADDSITAGHGGGDDGIINALYDYLTGVYSGSAIPDIDVSVDSHLTVFAAEKARLTGEIVDLDEYKSAL